MGCLKPGVSGCTALEAVKYECPDRYRLDLLCIHSTFHVFCSYNTVASSHKNTTWWAATFDPRSSTRESSRFALPVISSSERAQNTASSAHARPTFSTSPAQHVPLHLPGRTRLSLELPVAPASGSTAPMVTIVVKTFFAVLDGFRRSSRVRLRGCASL